MRLNAPETTVVCQITINTILNYNPIYEKVFRNTFDSTHCYAVSREICVTKTTFLGCQTYQNDLNRFMRNLVRVSLVEGQNDEISNEMVSD